MDGEIEAPTPALAEARELTLQAAMQAGQVQALCGLQVAPEDFVNGALKWGLMEVGITCSLPCEASGAVWRVWQTGCCMKASELVAC